MQYVWLLTTGDGSDGNEWGLEDIFLTEESALAAKAVYETPRARGDGSSYNFSANVEKWEVKGQSSSAVTSLNILWDRYQNEDDVTLFFRYLLISSGWPIENEEFDNEDMIPIIARVRDLVCKAEKQGGSEWTDLLLAHSLCPVHRVDYAICFGNDNPKCSQVRQIHPEYDT